MLGTMHTESGENLPSPDLRSGVGPSLRVLHLTISFARGGRRDAIVSLARSLQPLGAASHLVTLRGDPAETLPFVGDFETILRLGVTGLPSPGQIARLRQHCKSHQIDVVHAHDAASQFVASLLHCVVPSLRVVMTFHRSLPFESAGWRNRLRNAVSLRMVSRVMTASAERQQHFRRENRFPPDKVVVIPLGVDQVRFAPDDAARQQIRAELGLSADQHLVVAMGHFGEEKGIDQAVRAAAAALERLGPGRLQLVVLGSGGPERIKVIHQLGAELLGETVTFLGHRSDPERWLAAADVLLHLPRLEAFGLVVVQAMSCATPVVAADVGGLPEIVIDGETGHLVSGDRPEVAGAVLTDLLSDRKRRESQGRRGLERARREYADQVSAGRHRALYDEVMKAN